jgi:hypothetical protein
MAYLETFRMLRALRKLKPDPVPEEAIRKSLFCGSRAICLQAMSRIGFLAVRSPSSASLARSIEQQFGLVSSRHISESIFSGSYVGRASLGKHR